MNGNSKGTNGLVVPGQEFFSALAALVGPVENIFSSTYTIPVPLSPVVLGRLSLSMCHWEQVTSFSSFSLFDTRVFRIAVFHVIVAQPYCLSFAVKNRYR